MEDSQKHISDISEIRSMMERASKFISLSGISGVSAGIVALIGASVAFWYLNVFMPAHNEASIMEQSDKLIGTISFLFADAFATFLMAFAFAIIFTTRNSKKKNIPIWDFNSKRILIHLLVPLFAAFLFIIALVYYRYYLLIIPSSLIFYGLSLINAGHFTFRDIKILGYLELFLGLVSLLLVHWALYFWAFGFGFLHIIYGAMMYFKYEQ